MSSKDRNDGWATPKRCQSKEKDLHFMKLKPHDVTVAKGRCYSCEDEVNFVADLFYIFALY